MEDELYHYGVKGMKWGVRKRIEGARRSFNSSPEVQYLRRRARDRAADKAYEYAARSEMSNVQYRRDKYAGKAQRQARKAEAMDRALRGDTRSANAMRIQGIRNALSMTPATEGRIARYKDLGYSTSYSVLKSYGRETVHGVTKTAAIGAVGIAASVVVAKAALRTANKHLSKRDDWKDV